MMKQGDDIRGIQEEVNSRVESRKGQNLSSTSKGFVNRFAILETVEEQSELIEETYNSYVEYDSVVDNELMGVRKMRATVARVAELMKTLKSKKKGQNDKGKKQRKVGSNAFRNNSSTFFL